LDPRGDPDGLPNVVRLGREPDIQTISYEVIMTTIAAVTELQPTDLRKSQDARNHQGRDAPLNDDVLMERIFGNMSTTPWEEVLKRIASLPDIRQAKVMDIRRQITERTYEVGDRLDRAIDRVLEAITA
jgi:hypothetical protein